MRFLFFLFAVFFSGLALFAQEVTVKGSVTDPAGAPVSYASVYVKNTAQGTAANHLGEYQLRIAPGDYQLVFSAIGFQQQVKQVNLATDTALHVVLTPAVFTLNDVVIRSAGEDPAYAIIKEAIRKRKTHLNEVNAYTTNVYIKGVQRMLEAPKRFLGKDIDKVAEQLGLDSNRQGILYFSESLSKLSFLKPHHYREEMISSKVSGNNRAFSFNRATDLNVNFYENLFRWDGISSRPLISPIADNALFYYDYRLLGVSMENGELINKIQVIPKRRNDPVFGGILYIVENSWRIHAVDLNLTKDAGINFVDNLHISQQFYHVNGTAWMPSSVRLQFTGRILSFRFGGYFVAVYSDYDLEPMLDRKDFAEVLRINGDVSNKDSSYWREIRPIPLTNEEKADYNSKQALAVKRESAAYLDSLDKIGNSFKVIPFFLKGYRHTNRYKGEVYHLSSPLTAVFYNTVEGWGANYGVSYKKTVDSAAGHILDLQGNLRYGSANAQFRASINGSIPVKKTTIGFNIGSDVTDLNDLGTISQLGNTINTLLYERNFLKLYEKKFAEFSLSRRLIGGLQGVVFTGWSNRQWLPNAPDFQPPQASDDGFTSNNPFSPLTAVPLFSENQAFKAGAALTYDFSNKYITYPSGRTYVPSKYPTIKLSYTKGIKHVLASDVNFDLLSADLSQTGIPLGLYGKTSFYVAAGTFINKKSLFYTDFKHFAGNQTLAFEPRNNGFLLLPYYLYSTPDRYVEAHVEHNFSGFILNKVPLIRKLKLQELIYANFLTTPVLHDYLEVAFGLQHVFGIKALYALSYSDSRQLHSGFKIAYGL